MDILEWVVRLVAAWLAVSVFGAAAWAASLARMFRREEQQRAEWIEQASAEAETHLRRAS